MYASRTSSLWSNQNCRNFEGEMKYKSVNKKFGDTKQEIPLLEFCKIGKSDLEVKESRPCQQCRTSSLLLSILQNSRSSISCFCIPLFLVIRLVFHFTSKILFAVGDMDPIPWIRCASGNVFYKKVLKFTHTLC